MGRNKEKETKRDRETETERQRDGETERQTEKLTGWKCQDMSHLVYEEGVVALRRSLFVSFFMDWPLSLWFESLSRV